MYPPSVSDVCVRPVPAKGDLVPFSELDEEEAGPEPAVQPPPAAPAAAAEDEPAEEEH